MAPGIRPSRRWSSLRGHENLGIVEAIGPGGAIAHDGTALRAGDRMVPAPNRACGVCRTCQRGFPYYLCRNLENYGNSLSCAEPPHLFGGWAEFLYLRPRTPVFRVPQGLPSEVAVLAEIFAVTHSLERIAAIRRPGGFLPGDTVAVVGVGSLGMAHLVKAALMGAGGVIAVDKSARRLALARRVVNAGTVAVGSPAGGSDDTARAQVLEVTGGEGADVVVNATGFPGSFSLAASLVRDASTILEVGAFVDMGPEAFNPAIICGRSLTVMGTGGEDLQAYDGTIALLARTPARSGSPRWSPTRSASLMPRSPSRPRWMPAPPRRSSSRTRSARPERARTRRCRGLPSVR